MRHIFLCLILIIVGFAASAADARRMGGIDWRVSDINGIPVLPNSSLTLRMGEGKVVSGSGGCNSFSGQYRTMSKEGVRFSGITATQKACAPEIMDQERRFLSILESVEGYSFYSDGGVSLISPDGRAIRFIR